MATLGSSSRRLGNRLLLLRTTRLARRPTVSPRQSMPLFSLRNKSTDTSNAMDEPGKFVSGLTKEQVEADPAIAEFLRVNFVDVDKNKDGISVPMELLKEYGYSESDFPPDTGKKYGDPRIDKGLGTAEQQALNIRTLFTYMREEEGHACALMRENGMIPGVISGGDPTQGIISNDKSSRIMVKTDWSELQRELDRYHRRFESRVYDVTLYQDESDTEGTVHRVLPRDVQRHPVRGTIYCANFLRYHAGRPIKLPIVYINMEESAALKRDAYIIPVNRYIECLVDEGVPIPKAVELECTGLKLKDVIRLDRLIFPDGVTVSKRVNKETFLVGPVAGGRSAADAEADAAEEKAALESKEKEKAS